MVLVEIIFFIASLVSLWFGGEALIKGSKNLAIMLGIPSFIIGLSLVAFGTSAPELFVNLLAAYKNESDIVYGNVIGSNISNSLLILGISIIIFPLSIKKFSILKSTFISLISLIILMILILFIQPINELNFIHGIVLILFFALYLYDMAKNEIESKNEKTKDSFFKALFLCLFGVVLMPLSANLLVENAIAIAKGLNFPISIISLIGLALGTSLPELIACTIAAIKKDSELILGSIIGSNTFNILLIMGSSSFLSSLKLNFFLNSHLYICAGTMIAISCLFIYSFKFKKIINRKTGMILFCLYGLYIGFIIQKI